MGEFWTWMDTRITLLQYSIREGLYVSYTSCSSFLFLCLGNGSHALCVCSCKQKFSGRTEHYSQCRHASHKLFSKLHQQLCSVCVSSQKASISLNGSLHAASEQRTVATEGTGVPLAFTILHEPKVCPYHFHHSWPLCKGGVSPVASHKMYCELTVCSQHPVCWWGRICKEQYNALL